jgi:hypothetical protein
LNCTVYRVPCIAWSVPVEWSGVVWPPFKATGLFCCGSVRARYTKIFSRACLQLELCLSHARRALSAAPPPLWLPSTRLTDSVGCCFLSPRIPSLVSHTSLLSPSSFPSAHLVLFVASPSCPTFASNSLPPVVAHPPPLPSATIDGVPLAHSRFCCPFALCLSCRRVPSVYHSLSLSAETATRSSAITLTHRYRYPVEPPFLGGFQLFH